MNFKELKSKLFVNEEEIIINKKVNIQNKEIFLLSFIKGEDTNKLFALYKSDNHIEEANLFEPEGELEEFDNYDEEEYMTSTNRNELVQHINSSNKSLNIFFKEMTIQGQVVTFQSASTGALEYYDWSEMVIIQHFIKEGLIPKEFDNVNLENIILAKFEQNEEETFPQINFNEDIDITLIVDERSEEVLIQHPFTVKLGNLEKDTKIYYDIEDTKKKNYFYLDEISRYDIWKDVDENLDETLNKIDEDQREEFKNEYLSCTEEQCPKNMDLLTIYYETPDNSQLRFLAKKYLEDEPNYSSSALIMFTSCNDEKGVNGNKKYVDYLIPIEKDFKSHIEIELFSKYVHIPCESITFKI